MAHFSYRTRGNSTPQNKERIYFTCHPLDFRAYFEPICSDILECQNCAIWYRTELEQKRDVSNDESSLISADSGANEGEVQTGDEDLATEMERQFGGTKSGRDLGFIHDKLGTYFCENVWEHYEAAFRIREKLVKETGSPECREDLCISYDNLGNLYYMGYPPEEHEDYNKAVEYYKKALRIREELVKETGTVRSRRILLRSYDRIVELHRIFFETDEVRKYYEAGLRISEDLAKETGSVESRRDLCASYNNMGETCRCGGDYMEVMGFPAEEAGYEAEAEEYYEKAREHYAEARSYYEKGLKICIELVKETGTVWSRRNLSISYELLGNIIRDETGDEVREGEYYEKAYRICRELADETGMAKEYEDLAVACQVFGTRRYKQDEMLKKALEIWENLASQHPAIPRYKASADDVRLSMQGKGGSAGHRKVDWDPV